MALKVRIWEIAHVTRPRSVLCSVLRIPYLRLGNDARAGVKES